MPQPQPPQLKSFLISPPVRRGIEAQDAANPTPIPVIVTFREAKDDPVAGVSGSKQHVRDFLIQRGYVVRESDFFLFARLLPADILALADLRDWVYQIWKDETCYAHLLSSVDTVKASACWRTFEARGKGIVWAVLD